MLMGVPNLPHDSVPVGADENANTEVRQWGTPRSFDFPARDHADIGPALGIDFDTGARLSGSRFTFLRGAAARLHRALAQFMLDVQTRRAWLHRVLHALHRQPRNPGRHGAVAEIQGRHVLGQSRGGDEERAEQYLISTSEISLTNTVREQSPRRRTTADQAHRAQPVLSFSEAGSGGRDTRGMIRQHQFDKVEMVQITAPDKSYETLGADGRPCRSHPAKARAAVPRGSACAPATWVSAVQRPMTSKSGCRRKTRTAKSARAATAKPFRRGGCRRASRMAQGKNELVHTLERLGPRGRPRDGGGDREPPAGGRLDQGARSVAAVPWWRLMC